MSAFDSHIRLSLPRADFRLDVDISLPERGITILFGASGSGKTSILRCVAGLERAENGVIRIGGQLWQDAQQGIFLPTWQRPVGYVFQEASLFEHLDVAGNLAYGLKRVKSAAARQTLDDAIALLGISSLLKRRPAELSGGERQRVAIARALATQPQVLLLDEPLAALDLARRQEILPWLERLRDELHTPMLYVTHSADEVARLADHLVVLERGQVKATGPVADVLLTRDSPMTIGEDTCSLLSGQIISRDLPWQLMCVGFDGGSLWLRDNGLAIGHKVRLRVLARDISITTIEPQQTSIQNHLPAVIESMTADSHPSQTLVRLHCGPSRLQARITRRAADSLRLAPGQAVWVQIKSVALIG